MSESVITEMQDDHSMSGNHIP